MTLFGPDEAAPALPPGPLARLRLDLAYDGTGFAGFAVQPGQRTVAGALAQALGRVCGHPVTLTCAGRTDRGVHAWGQVVHLDTKASHDPAVIQRSCNRQLAPSIVVRAASWEDADFDARFSATGRRYRYTVVNRLLPDPFLARTAWHVREPLDLGAMRLACDPLIGTHDWTSFCRQPPEHRGAAAVDHPPPPMLRTVRDARWLAMGDGLLRFDIEASAFCQQMVRSLVGTLVAVGRAKLRAGDVAGILAAHDRSVAAPPAPPHGLVLWEVLYDEPSGPTESGR